MGVQLCVSFTGLRLDVSQGGGGTRVCTRVITHAAACLQALGDSAWCVHPTQVQLRECWKEVGVGGTNKRQLARRAKYDKGNLASSNILYVQALAGSVLWGLGGYT